MIPYLMGSLSSATLRQVKRRVGINLAPQGTQSRCAVGHFHAVTDAQKKKALHLNLESRTDTKLGLGSREFLRVYYTDLLCAPSAKGPAFANKEETQLECDEWVRWIQDVNPRTRVDAYPLLLVCKDLLGKLARNEVQIISGRIDELASKLRRADATIQAQLALDDLQIQSIDDSTSYPNRWAFTVTGFGALGRRMSWQALYSQASNLAFRTSNPSDNFQDAGVGLGRAVLLTAGSRPGRF